MKTNKQILLIILVPALLLTCEQKVKLANTNKLKGLWTLHIMETKDSTSNTWSEWRNGMQGYILYDDTENMSLHITTKGYEQTNIQFPNFTDTISEYALKYLTNSYVYFAKYTIDKEKNIVKHARISHSNPGEWNKIVERRFYFSGDTLILQPVEQKNSGLRLKWVKAPALNNK